MSKNQLALLRLASKISDALHRPGAGIGAVECSLSRLSDEGELLQRIRRKLAVCAEQNWHGAAKRVLESLQYCLNAIRTELCRCEELLGQDDGHVPALRPVYEDLCQIEDEFGEVTYHRGDQFLSVIADPIELEGIELGRFEIRLLVNRLADGEPQDSVRVVAREPHPAVSDPRATHPHVSDERLCAGDASEPLRRALVSGRLCDAFLIVRSVLKTYNPESPYVSLDNWEGTPCWDCGCPASEDSSFWCQCCEYDFCDDCIGYCHSCDTNLCRGCLSKCARCEEPFCESCLEPCAECGESCCGMCLEDGVCQPCLEAMENNDEEQSANNNEHVTEKKGAAEAGEAVSAP